MSVQKVTKNIVGMLIHDLENGEFGHGSHLVADLERHIKETTIDENFCCNIMEEWKGDYKQLDSSFWEQVRSVSELIRGIASAILYQEVWTKLEDELMERYGDTDINRIVYSFFECDCCGEIVYDESGGWSTEDGNVCENCFESYYYECNECSKYVHKYYYNHDLLMCRECAENDDYNDDYEGAK